MTMSGEQHGARCRCIHWKDGQVCCLFRDKTETKPVSISHADVRSMVMEGQPIPAGAPEEFIHAAISDASDGDVDRMLRQKASVDDVMRFFSFSHLPPHLRPASRPFAILALRIAISAPRCAQRTISLNKLLESKDAAVRTFVNPL